MLFGFSAYEVKREFSPYWYGLCFRGRQVKAGTAVVSISHHNLLFLLFRLEKRGATCTFQSWSL
jgi:hypothetical protein